MYSAESQREPHAAVLVTNVAAFGPNRQSRLIAERDDDWKSTSWPRKRNVDNEKIEHHQSDA